MKQVRKETRSAVGSRQRRHHEDLGDIGQIPEVRHKKRRAACSKALERFAVTYFPHLCFRPFSVDAKAMMLALEGGILRHGRSCHALPRGSGKTTIILIAMIWAILYAHRRFLVVAAATKEHAENLIADIIREFETNELLLEDFPEVVYPFLQLEGRYQRAQTQSYAGQRTRIKCKTSQLVMPTIPGSKASGVIIRGTGVEGAVRGMKSGRQRPDFLAIDDPQTRESAKSPSQTRDRENTITGDLLGLAGHDKQISAVMCVTVICADDLSDRFLDRDRYPDWQGHRGKLVYQWPTDTELWGQYEALWRQDNQASDGQFKNATAFYQAHREAMDAGAAVADPELYDRSFELSALQHAYNLRFSTKENFWAEYQNSPQSREVQLYDLAPRVVAGRINRLRRWELDPAVRSAVAFADINFEGMRWALVGWAQDGAGFVADYGKWPERAELVKKNSSKEEQKRAVAVGIHGLVRHLSALPVVRGGRGFPLRAVGIDRGFLPEAVHQTVRQIRAPWPVLPCKGYGATQYKPAGKHIVGKPGHNCHLSDGELGQFMASNVDYFKEVVQRGFLVPPGVPGSLSFYAGADHDEIGEHVCAEVLTDKAEGARGTFWKFSKKPGANNGWFDALVGCLSLATWFLGLTPLPPPAPGETGDGPAAKMAPRRRVAAPPRRRCKVEVED